MNRNRMAAALAASVLVLSTHPLGADVRADQKTRIEFAGMLGRVVNIFGGKAAREGVTSTVAVKGSRKATTTGQTGQIIDLTEEKIYDVDLKKKSYKVTTFAACPAGGEDGNGRCRQGARDLHDEHERSAEGRYGANRCGHGDSCGVQGRQIGRDGQEGREGQDGRDGLPSRLSRRSGHVFDPIPLGVGNRHNG